MLVTVFSSVDLPVGYSPLRNTLLNISLWRREGERRKGKEHSAFLYTPCCYMLCCILTIMLSLQRCCDSWQYVNRSLKIWIYCFKNILNICATAVHSHFLIGLFCQKALKKKKEKLKKKKWPSTLSRPAAALRGSNTRQMRNRQKEWKEWWWYKEDIWRVIATLVLSFPFGEIFNDLQKEMSKNTPELSPVKTMWNMNKTLASESLCSTKRLWINWLR